MNRDEMARNIEDFLSRRRKCLILNAKHSAEMAPVVAKIMEKEFRKNDKWEKIQCENYAKLVKNYTIN